VENSSKKKLPKKAAKPFLHSASIIQTKTHGPIRRTATIMGSNTQGGGVSGSSGAQSVAQSPLYYDYRWSSPDKFYFPKNRVVANAIWREIYKRDPAIAISTDLYADLPWSEFDLTGIDDPSIRRVFEDQFSNLNLVPKLSNFTRDYLITGELILHTMFNSTQGVWDRVIPHNPDYVKIEGVGLVAEQPLLWLLPTPEIKRLLNSADPRMRRLQKLLPKEIVNAFRMNREIPLDPLNTTYLARLNSSTDIRGTSMYTRLFRVVMYEDFIVNASLAVAQRNAAPLRIFKLGDPNTGWLPDEEDEAAFAEMLSMAEADPLAAIVMHHNVTAELVGVSDRVLLISKEWDFVERVKLLAMGISKAFLTGESSFSCFEQGTPVLMHDGTPIPVEEVKDGDLVLDQDGNAQRVVNNWCEGVPEELLEIEVWGGRKFRVTPNHRFPAWMWPSKCVCGCGENVSTPGRAFANNMHYAKMKEDAFSYVDCPAMVHQGRHRITRLPAGYDPNKVVEARELRKGDFLKIPNNYGVDISPTDVTPGNPVTPGMARLLGYYLAEGDIAFSKLANGNVGKPCQVRLTFHIKEKDTWAKDIIEICNSVRIPCTVATYDKRPNICVVRVTPKDKTVIDWFTQNAGRWSYYKKLSNEVMHWPVELLRELIIGYIRGDGTRSDKPTPSQIINSGIKALACVQVGTVSPALASQIMLILNRLGFTVGKAVAIPPPSKYNRKPYHILRIQGKAAIELAQLVWNETLVARHNRCSVWRDDKYTYVPIRSVKVVKNTNPVYNLEVENSHTYLVCDGLATCNSAVAGLQTLLERLSSLRNKFEQDWIIKKLCNPISEIHEFYKRTEAEISHRIRVKRPLEDTELIVPTIRWKKGLEPTQDVAILNIWRDLKERGIISERTYGAGAGIDIATERKNIAEERKFKLEHPEIYGVPPPQGQPGAPGTKAPLRPALPAPAAPVPAASAKHNPYLRSASTIVDEVEDDLAFFFDKKDKNKVHIHIDDLKEIISSKLETSEDKDQKAAEVANKLPLATTKLLSGE
jgi:hypothetical protein